MTDRTITRALGWLSLGMGLTLLAPRRAAVLFGLGPRPALMRAIAARDIAIGAGLLAAPAPAPWLRAQAAADLLDAAILVHTLRARRGNRPRALTWLLFASCAAVVALNGAGRAGR